MVIKVEGYIGMILLMFGGILSFLFLLYSDGASLAFIVFSGVLLMPIGINYWIVIGKKLILDENGCSVRFLWYKKNYRWEELQVKRVEDYRYALGDKGLPYLGGVIFSSHKVHKPRWMQPISYNLLHPFSFFFVYFWPKGKIKKGIKYPDFYEVDEIEFRERMKNWGIELEDMTKKGKV